MGDRKLHLVGNKRLADVTLEELDLRRRVVRDSEVANLAGVRQLVEGACHLFRLDEGIGAVQEEDVDVVGVERSQRPIDGLDDVFVGEVEIRPVLHDAGLRLQHDLVPLRGGQLQGFGEPGLAAVRRPVPIDVGVVEEGDAGRQRRVEQRSHLLVRLLLDAHHPGDDSGNDQVGAGHGERLHGVLSFSVGLREQGHLV